MKTAYSRFGKELSDFLVELAEELGHLDDKEHAFNITKAVFQVCRNRMSIEESFEIIDLLPLFLKGVYVDEWHVQSNHDPIQELSDFEAEMLDGYGVMSVRDFLPRDRIIIAIKDFFRVLARHLESYEQQEMYNALPDAVKPLWEETVLV
jgi:uncharacterized protein (DUF2267 family)